MQAPPADVSVALTIIQVVGLLLPIVFISLQPFYRPIAEKVVERQQHQPQDESQETVTWERDEAPDVIVYGIPIAVLFALSALFAGLKIFIWAIDSPLVALSLLLLVSGVAMVSYLFYKVRKSFINEMVGV